MMITRHGDHHPGAGGRHPGHRPQHPGRPGDEPRRRRHGGGRGPRGEGGRRRRRGGGRRRRGGADRGRGSDGRPPQVNARRPPGGRPSRGTPASRVRTPLRRASRALAASVRRAGRAQVRAALQPIGAFKIRGAYTAIARLAEPGRRPRRRHPLERQPRPGGGLRGTRSSASAP